MSVCLHVKAFRHQNGQIPSWMSVRFIDRFMTQTAVLFEPGNRLSRDEGLDYDTSGVLFFRRIHLTPGALKGHRQVSTLTAGVTPGHWPTTSFKRPAAATPAPVSSYIVVPTRQQQISSLLFTRSVQTAHAGAHKSLIYSQNSTEPLEPSTHSFPALKSHLLFGRIVTST